MDTILRISDAANLAIHAMAHIARAKGNLNHSVGEISSEQGVSVAHLSKVMQRLVKVGLLTDCKCLLGRKKCLFGGCALGALLTHVNHQVRVFMASRNLTDLTGSSLKHTLYLAGLSAKEAGEKPKRARTAKAKNSVRAGLA